MTPDRVYVSSVVAPFLFNDAVTVLILKVSIFALFDLVLLVSMISFGSAAGVGVMGKLPGIYTFGSHMKYAWTIVIGYFVSIAVWYVQYEMLGLYIKH